MNNCQQKGCKEKAHYCYDWSNPIYCKHHKKEDMVYVTYKRCEKEECIQKAIFGKERKYATHCREHAEDYMINLSAKLCEKEHCKKRAIYGNAYKKPILCIKHASEHMFYALYKACEKVNCNHKANYGKKWGDPSYCKEHMSIKTMEYVSYERCREENGCINKAVYDNQTKKRYYCEKHIIIEKKDEKDEEKEHRNYFSNKDKWIDLNTENKLIINIKNFKEVSDSFNLYGTDNVLIFSWHALERMNEREITKTELFYELHNTPNKITEFDILSNGVNVCISTNNYIIISLDGSMKFSFGNYKTKSKFGIQLIPINKYLQKVINYYIKYSNNKKVLFDVSGSLFSKWISDAFNIKDKNLSLNMIRHIYVSEKYPANTQERKKVAENMGHSLYTNINYSLL